MTYSIPERIENETAALLLCDPVTNRRLRQVMDE